MQPVEQMAASQPVHGQRNCQQSTLPHSRMGAQTPGCTRSTKQAVPQAVRVFQAADLLWVTHPPVTSSSHAPTLALCSACDLLGPSDLSRSTVVHRQYNQNVVCDTCSWGYRTRLTLTPPPPQPCSHSQTPSYLTSPSASAAPLLATPLLLPPLLAGVVAGMVEAGPP
jgi:hypothetical protein